YEVQNIVCGDLRELHVGRTCFYAGKEVNMTSDMCKTFPVHPLGDLEMEEIMDIHRIGKAYEVSVDWLGLCEDERTGESLDN
ncbi:unnamed protein product, partial [Discosporangium mesarthrocarpum]